MLEGDIMKVDDKKIKALISPHAGYIYSGQTATWGYRQLSDRLINPHFVLIGPSHNYGFEGMAANSALYWQTPLGQVKQIPSYDSDKNIFAYDEVHKQEHSVEVQIPFLQHLYQKLSVSCFLTGQSMDFHKVSNWLLEKFPKNIFIFSSDLSHYLPLEKAEEKDKKTIDAVLQLDDKYFLENENTACGAIGLLLLMKMAGKMNWQRKLIHYETSLNVSDDEEAVVGYSSIAFYE